ncbi:hypothetical protein [Peptoniphilus timonensis]|uniref:hypothetical protein n=1 Tax=Peptoniphilus timonensis TaxID=1268254 RepID=UPI0002EE4444|nr:hypothetical protein [Peptoniphilus timonensis]
MSNIYEATNYSDDDFEKDYKEYKKTMGKMFDEYKKYVNEHSKEEIRKETIMWLENTRASGAFENQAENNMNFNDLSDDEIDWYFEEWVFPEKFNSDNF